MVADPRKGQLQARPAAPAQPIQAKAGVAPLGLASERDTLLYVPAGYQIGQRYPLVVLLHGAGSRPEAGIGLLQSFADQAGLLLLAPGSRYQTWDVIAAGYGPDVELIDQGLDQIFGSYNVDPSRIAIGGFSDGASYALSLGLINGTLFRQIIAFSPGFMAPSRQTGTPRIFISHGTHDTVLPIERCSRRIVVQLERAGYAVTYREFNGPHTVPAEVAREAVGWYLRSEASGAASDSPVP